MSRQSSFFLAFMWVVILRYENSVYVRSLQIQSAYDLASFSVTLIMSVLLTIFPSDHADDPRVDFQPYTKRTSIE
jgi:hypothetical protein